MFVLLREEETNERYYLYIDSYSVEVERLLIELYYRNLISGLIDYSSLESLEDVHVHNIDSWLERVNLRGASDKSLEAVERLKSLI